MDNFFEITSAAGPLRLRPETCDDAPFSFRLFCDSRAGELALLPLAGTARDHLMRIQFRGQALTYRERFPEASFDIIELGALPIGRLVVDRTEERIHLVDVALIQEMRNRGLGTIILRRMMDEGRVTGVPIRLKVNSGNEAALRLYLRLGFVPVQTLWSHVELECGARRV